MNIWSTKQIIDTLYTCVTPLDSDILSYLYSNQVRATPESSCWDVYVKFLIVWNENLQPKLVDLDLLL